MNRDFIKQIILDEMYNVRHSQIVLLESVSSWPEIQKLFASNKIEPWTFRGLEAYSYDDATLGQLDLYSDGNAYITPTKKTVPWQFKDNSIYIDGQKINIQQVTQSIQKTKSSWKQSATQKTQGKATEYEKLEAIDKIQTVLDWVGFIPGFGDILDAINAVIYFARGKYLDGALSLVAIIPVVGSGIKLGLKGTIASAGGALTAARIWKSAAKGSPNELANFYKIAIESGKLDKTQLRSIAKHGDEIAELLTRSKRYLRNYSPGSSMDDVAKQIDDISAAIRNTTSIPIKQSMLSKIGVAIKTSKAAAKTASAGKFAFKAGANLATFGGFGIALNIVKKLGIGKREMKYLKDAMDLRFMKKITASPTLTTAMFKSNKRLTAAQAASLGVPPWLSAKSTREIHDWFTALQKADPLKWKQVSNAVAKNSADLSNPYYTRFVNDAFSQGSNIFRPGTVLQAGYPEMFAKIFKLDSYRLSNPKNLDIVKNEIEDLAEKLGLDSKDDPNGVIMPAIFMVFNKFLTDTKDAVIGTTVGATAISAAGYLGGEDSTANAEKSIPGGTVVDNQPEESELQSIKSDFKSAEGTTTERLQALAEKGWEDAQIYALKQALDIE
jgi:hypothetical protein